MVLSGETRGLIRDENAQAVQCGSEIELKLITASYGAGNPFNFSERPKAILFGTRSNVTPVAIWKNTATVAATDPYWTIQSGVALSIACASSGPWYVRTLSSGVESLVEMVGLL